MEGNILLKWFDNKKEEKKEEKEFAEPSNSTMGEKSILAKAMLDNPLYKEIILKIHTELNHLWINSVIDDTETREQIFHMRKMLEKIDKKFIAYVSAAFWEEKEEQ